MLSQATNEIAAIDAQAVRKDQNMREFIVRTARRHADRVWQRTSQELTGLLAIRIHIQAKLSSPHLRVLEMDRGDDQRIIPNLRAADLSRCRTAKYVGRGVEFAYFLHQTNIPQGGGAAEHEHEQRALRQRSALRGHPSACLCPYLLFCFHGRAMCAMTGVQTLRRQPVRYQRQRGLPAIWAYYRPASDFRDSRVPTLGQSDLKNCRIFDASADRRYAQSPGESSISPTRGSACDDTRRPPRLNSGSPTSPTDTRPLPGDALPFSR